MSLSHGSSENSESSCGAPLRAHGERRAGVTVGEEGGVSLAEVASAWADFERFLKERCCRITRTRRYVLEHVLSRRDHFTADQVADEMGSGRRRVSRATVYNTLALMAKSGVVRAVRDCDTHVHYEHVYNRRHHEHMICERCGCFVEFDAGEIERSMAAACRAEGFRMRAHQVTVFGVCERCASRDGTER